MGVTTTFTNKPINPRGNDASPLGYNRAALYSGKALDFDGVNDSIDISNFSLNGYTAFSICFYKVSDFNNGMIFSSADSIDDGVNIYQISPGYFRARLNGVNAIDTSLKVSDINGFFVFTYDGTNAKWYYQAQNIDSGTTSQTFAITNTTTTIARQSFASVQYLNGDIAGFKIFNTALTAAQVSDLYNNPEKIVPTGVEDTALKLWLPMMEGAGELAYDGSGNGNHGTINGATYVHGVGAPVAQSAVIDWNKGTNTIPESENPDNLPSFDARGFTKNSSTETSPIGTNDAHKYTENNTNSNPALVWSGDYSTGASQTLKVYLKADAATSLALSTQGQISGGNINVTTEWQQFEVTQSVNSTSGPHIGGFATITQGSGIVLYMWHPQMSYGDSVYIPTLATAQTTPVLLPQGLTSGRDITGVNLFENVRKQGALNLDGNSWAEVHDNASLDFTSGMSVECWVQLDYLDGFQHIFGKWNFPSQREFMIYYNLSAQRVDFYFGHNAAADTASFPITANGQYFHLVGTTDGTTITPYVNGVAGTPVAVATPLGANNLPVSIGTDYNKAVNQFVDKQLAQPRIYNRALTAEEVLRNYNSEKNTYQ